MNLTFQKTRPDRENDYAILVAGKIIGRVYEQEEGLHRGAWYWSLRDLGPRYEKMLGIERSLNDAKKVVRSAIPRLRPH